MLLCPGRGARLGLVVGLSPESYPSVPTGWGWWSSVGRAVKPMAGGGPVCFTSGCSGVWKEGSAMVPCPQIPESLSLCLAGWKPTTRPAVEATCPFSRLACPA